MPIFTRSYDVIAWLLQVTRHLQRVHRHDFTKRLLDAAFDMRQRLQQADEVLARLRLHPHAQPRSVLKVFAFLGFRVFAARRRVKGITTSGAWQRCSRSMPRVAYWNPKSRRP